MSTDGSWTIACATLTRCRIPFEYAGSLRASAGSRSTVSSARAAAASGPGRPCSLAASWTNSRAVRGSNTPSCCGTSPISRVTPVSARGSRPRMRTVPWDGRASPQSMRSMVDLPAPFGPSSAVTPAPTSKLTSDTATSAPNHFDTPSATTRGSIGTAVTLSERPPAAGIGASTPAFLRRWPPRDRRRRGSCRAPEPGPRRRVSRRRSGTRGRRRRRES